MVAPIRLEEESCGNCGVCFSACPFDAVSHNGNEVKIDLEKCQMCGICYSSCPSSLIDLKYYHQDLLLEEIEQKIRSGREDLVLMCRGSTPPNLSYSEIATIIGSPLDEFVSLRLPCVGRLRTEFYLKAIEMGINNIYIIQCGEGFCRYDRGSETSKIRALELNGILRQLGYGEAIRVVENPSVVEYEPDPQKCVGCDKCVYICPYDAIEVQIFGTPQIDYEKCTGCGLCTVICPHQSMYLRNFEPDRLSSTIYGYKEKIHALKERGVYPVILTFCCQWADFNDVDSASNGFLKENVALVEVPCFSALDPAHILQAFEAGFDDVMALVCPDEDCKSKESRKTAEQNLKTLQSVLKGLNLGGRFKVHKNHPRYPEGFETNLELFFEEVKQFEH